jgi:hypothetical protein
VGIKKPQIFGAQMAPAPLVAIWAPKILDFQCPPLITPLVVDVAHIQIKTSRPI